MTMLTIGVVKETAPGERRVALVPGEIGKLEAAGMAVLVETGAGAGAWFPDDAYANAGAEIVTAEELRALADVIVSVAGPTDEITARLRPGQVFLGTLTPLGNPGLVRELARRGVTAISFDGLPRTVSRAQSMDALTSQSNVAGYKAVLVAANAFGRYFPMLITAAGTARPARVFVLGAGVAGLQAIGTARRLGAVVSAYDVRPQAREDVKSLGAGFVDIGAALAGDGGGGQGGGKQGGAGQIDGAGEGGYARALGAAEQRAQQEAVAEHVACSDVVITTAQVPGRPPPLLVTEEAVKAMEPGSVIVDLAASRFGGNVALSRLGETIVTENGVTIVGAENLPATVPAAASAGYSRNVAALLLHLVRGGRLVIDPADEIQAGVLVTHDGRIIRPAPDDLRPDGPNS
jgi:NAD(P) transhydrogenase subunit alpha